MQLLEESVSRLATGKWQRPTFSSVVNGQRNEKDAANRFSVFSKLSAITAVKLRVYRASVSDDYMEHFKLLSSRRALTEGMEPKDQLVEEVLLLALFLVSTAGNSLSLLVFCRRPGLRTISNR